MIWSTLSSLASIFDIGLPRVVFAREWFDGSVVGVVFVGKVV